MKYIKTYEKLLKHSDPIVTNHPLLDFSERLVNIFTKIKKLDNLYQINSDTVSIKKYFNQNSIIISYNYFYSSLLKIKLITNKNNVKMIVRYEDSIITNNFNSIKFFDFLKDKLKKYISGNLVYYKSVEKYEFTIDQADEIIQEIEKFIEYIDIYTNINKYNL
jgi:hypothetical protein